MANYSQLKAAIADVIKTNGTKAITGQVLQNVLNSMVSVIGANYTFAGVATPATNPSTPDQNVVYFASQGGTYTNFNNIELPDGISLLMWNGSWSSKVFVSFNDIPDHLMNIISAPIPFDLTTMETVTGWISDTGECRMQNGSLHYAVPLTDIIEVTIKSQMYQVSVVTFATEIESSGEYTKLSGITRWVTDANESISLEVPVGANYLIIGVKSSSSSLNYTPSAVLLSPKMSELVDLLEKQQMAAVNFFAKRYIDYDSVNGIVKIPAWGTFIYNNKEHVFGSPTKVNDYYEIDNVTNTELGTTTAYLVYDLSFTRTQTLSENPFSIVSFANIPKNHAVVAVIRLVASSVPAIYPQMATMSPWSVNGMPYGFSSLKEDDGLVLPLTPAAISSQGENKGITLNIMSYNVANYNDDTETFLPNDKVIEYRRMLNEIVPDLVAIQEDREDIDGNGQKNAAQYLYNPVHPYLYIGGVQFPSVRSKVQTEVYGCLKYSNAERYFEYTTFQIEGKTLLFISTHIIASVNGSYSSAETIQVRSVQYEETIKWANGIITLNDKVSLEPVSAPQHDYVVIAGDFNTITDDDKTNLLSVLSTYNYTCANGGKLGWIKTAPRYSGTMLSLDNIICSPNVVIESVKSYYELYDKLYSDHVPLLAKVTLLDT